MNILIIMDSFKGTLSSSKAGSLISEYIKEIKNDINVKYQVFSDGGDGFLDALRYNMPNIKSFTIHTVNQEMNDIDVDYLLDEDDRCYLESSKIVPFKEHMSSSITRRTSYGFGIVLSKLIDRGIKEFSIGLGGTCTNDGGLGILKAFGAKFIDKYGNDIFPTPDKFSSITNIVLPKKINASINLLSDVSNVLLGKNGATYTFGRQKGATEEELQLLEDGLSNIDRIISKKYGSSYSKCEGTGAAGGIAFSLYNLFSSCKVNSGCLELFNYMNLNKLLADTDYVITGEGRTDYQTLDGKAVDRIVSRCQQSNKKVVVISGSIDSSIEKELKDKGVVGLYSLVDNKVTADDLKIENVYKNLKKAVRNMMSDLERGVI